MVAPAATDVIEPPSVMLPDEVTVPDRDRPLVEPVPLTEVTVPVFDVYPLGLDAGYAPRLVSACAAVVAFVPPLPIGSVPVTAVVKLTPESVPPRVRLPDEVTVPVSVRPLTVPAPETEVTVPVLLVKPLGLLAGYAPRADKAAAADVAPVPP